MFIYTLPILALYVSAIERLIAKKMDWWYFLNFIIAIFICGGYMCGSDWRNYETLYNSIDFSNLFYNYYMEYGFYIYMLPFKYLHIDFWAFMIFTKFLCYLSIISFIKEYAKGLKYVALLFFLPFFGYYLFIDNPLRNLIAVSVFLCSFKYIINRDLKRFLILFLIAISFHISAIVMPFLYVVLARKVSSRIFLIILIASFIFINNALLRAIISLFSFNQFVQWKIEAYLMGDGSEGMGQIFSIKMLICLMFFITTLCFRKSLLKKDVRPEIIDGSLWYVILYKIGLSLHIFYRFQLYLSVLYCISIASIALIVSLRSRPYYLTMIFGLCLASLMKLKDEGVKYVPYTNYFVTSITDPGLPYSIRSSYNYKHTPYKESIKSE